VVGQGLCRKIEDCVGSIYTDFKANEWAQLTFIPPLPPPVPSIVCYKVTFTLIPHALLILKLVCDNEK
jgi:hypothetical protein